jgi:hypothetical protein
LFFAEPLLRVLYCPQLNNQSFDAAEAWRSDFYEVTKLPHQMMRETSVCAMKCEFSSTR